MDALVELLLKTLGQVITTLSGNWPFLLFGALLATVLKLYSDATKIKSWLEKYRSASIFAATGAAVTTPLCSCGSTAVILGMMATSMPWAPIVAFMVSSPLTSPAQMIYSVGLFGWPFAITFFTSSIVLGIAGGFLAQAAEARGWLRDQARMRPIMGGSGEAPSADALPVVSVNPVKTRPGLRAFSEEVIRVSGRLLLLFGGFAFIGYFLNNLIPAAWVTSLFGSGNTWGVFLASVLGLPLYMNTEASMPLVRAFIDGGASPGAALAFMITGAGTSMGAIAGALTIARWRVVTLVIATLWVGAILFGYGYNALVLTGLF